MMDSWRCAQVGDQPVEIHAACFQLEPHRVGPAGNKTESGQLSAAAAAQLCTERVTGILQYAVEQMLWPDPGVTAAGSKPGGNLEGAFGQEVDAQLVGTGLPAAPPAPDPPLGSFQRGRPEACLQALPYLLYVDAQRPQCRSRVGARSQRRIKAPEPGTRSSQVEPVRFQQSRSPAVAMAQQPQQHVLIANARHVELAGLSKRELHHLLAIGGQPGPYRPGPV